MSEDMMQSLRAEAERIGVDVPPPSPSRKGQSSAKPGAAANDKASQATRLVDLTTGEQDGAELWHTPEFECYATIIVNSHKENQMINTSAFNRWLAGQYYQVFGKAPSSQALQDALSVLGGKALYGGEEHSVHTRLALHSCSIYLDLANETWQAVKITSTGWEVVSVEREELLDGKFRFRYWPVGGEAREEWLAVTRRAEALP
tara:strand:- start:9330 stop:9938 length:609 start_codon:yes stop_codon:yes gene_type:complete